MIRIFAAMFSGAFRLTAVLRHIVLLLLLAAPLAAQTSEPLLRLTLPGDTSPRLISRDDLLALPQQRFVTATIWTEGVVAFEGPTLHDLLAAQGITADPQTPLTARLVALNHYFVDMPVTEATPEAPILALTRDGVALTARDKGPLWVVYPYDADRAYRSEVIYARSIWQLTEILVMPAAPAR